MTTCAELIEETRSHASGGHRSELNRLDGAASAAATSLTFKYDLGAIRQGAVVSVGLERVRVWETSAAKVASVVERGVDGSAAVSHLDLAVARVNTQFDDFACLRALNHELDALSAPSMGLFRIVTIDLTWAASTYGYNLLGVTDIEDVLSVQWEGYTGDEWIPVSPKEWRLGRSQSTTDFASGLALFFDSPVSGRAVRVVYKAPFTRLATLADNVESVTGLPASAIDIPPLGAAARLVAPTEAARVTLDVQGNTRRAEEVPAGARFNTARGLMALRDEAVRREATRLARDFPVSLSR